MTRHTCLTIPLVPLGIFATWAAAAGLLVLASLRVDAWISALWGIAALSLAVTFSVGYFVGRQNELLTRAFDLGRQVPAAQPAEVTQLRQ